ncbi:MAG TPA: hypothetical protein VHS96_10115, partial [Bacteroidia bacterium]|nr:hypothetical protein [Bacteroidia bacterium]
RQWTPIRWVRLGMGLVFVMAGMDGHEPWIAVFGAILATSSILGVSQCDQSCAPQHPEKNSDINPNPISKDGR